jgi:hypothetical protein
MQNSYHKLYYWFSENIHHTAQFMTLTNLLDAGKEVSLERNIDKTQYMLLSHHQNEDQNHDLKMFENVAQFKYLRMTVTNRNLI